MLETVQQCRPRKLLNPSWDGGACLFMTAHAARRLDERFYSLSIKWPPFILFTHYCEADDIDRPVWVIPIDGGYILGRWEESLRPEVPYQHWFVATTCITERQFNNSHLKIIKSVRVNVLRVMNQLHYWKSKGIAKN